MFKTVDESFAVRHTNAGILGMANQGRNTNSSQFYITLRACPWMDKKYVAFGYVLIHDYVKSFYFIASLCSQVIEGLQVLNKLEEVATYNERPTHLCQVSNCGLLPLMQYK